MEVCGAHAIRTQLAAPPRRLTWAETGMAGKSASEDMANVAEICTVIIETTYAAAFRKRRKSELICNGMSHTIEHTGMNALTGMRTRRLGRACIMPQRDMDLVDHAKLFELWL